MKSLTILSLISVAFSLPIDHFEHKVVLSENFILEFNAEDENDLEFQVTAETSGYVGLGFSPNGGMKNADIFIAWIDDQDGSIHAEVNFILNSFLHKVRYSKQSLKFNSKANSAADLFSFVLALRSALP